MRELELMAECKQLRAERDAARRDADQVRLQLLEANQQCESPKLATRNERHRCAEIARKMLTCPGGPAARAVAEVILAKILDSSK